MIDYDFFMHMLQEQDLYTDEPHSFRIRNDSNTSQVMTGIKNLFIWQNIEGW